MQPPSWGDGQPRSPFLSASGGAPTDLCTAETASPTAGNCFSNHSSGYPFRRPPPEALVVPPKCRPNCVRHPLSYSVPPGVFGDMQCPAGYSEAMRKSQGDFWQTSRHDVSLNMMSGMGVAVRAPQAPDRSPVTRGRSVAEYPLLHAPHPTPPQPVSAHRRVLTVGQGVHVTNCYTSASGAFSARCRHQSPTGCGGPTNHSSRTLTTFPTTRAPKVVGGWGGGVSFGLGQGLCQLHGMHHTLSR